MEKKRTIIFVQNIEYPQQGAIDIFYYSKNLAEKEKISVKVIIASIGEDISHENLELIELGKINYFSFILKSFRIIQENKKNNNIDYVYFFAQHPFSVILQFFVRYILGIKTVYDVVSGPIGKGIIPFISYCTIRIGVALSYKYVVLDTGLLSRLGLPKNKKFEVIPMGYDEKIFQERKNVNLFDTKDDEMIFTYIGSLDARRNLDIFIKSFLKILEEGKKVKLYFIGFGNSEEELKKISGKFLDKKIFFLGKKEHKDVPKYINSSDVLISYVPKKDYFEYQPPSKLIEYLACNKIVLATDTIAQEHILNGYKDLIHKDDGESTYKAILYVYKNFDTLKKQDFSRIVDGYSWKNLVEKIDNFLQ